VRLECRYQFTLPGGAELLVLRQLSDSHTAITFETSREDVHVVLARPEVDSSNWIARSEAEDWVVFAVSSVDIHIMTAYELERRAVELLEAIRSDIEKELFPLAAAMASDFLKIFRWRTGQFWLPDGLSSHPNFSVHFYVEGKRLPTASIHSTATLRSAELAFRMDSLRDIEVNLKGAERQDIRPLTEVLLLDARLYRSLRDYRVALLVAAVALEAELTQFAERQLNQRNVATQKEVRDFVSAPHTGPSKGLLATVVLGLLDVGNPDFRKRCKEVFTLRNKLVHAIGNQRATLEHASLAIDTAQQMLDIAGAG